VDEQIRDGEITRMTYPQSARNQLIVIVSVFEAGAPGLVATTEALPAAARSLAGIATVTWAASTIVVVR